MINTVRMLLLFFLSKSLVSGFPLKTSTTFLVTHCEEANSKIIEGRVYKVIPDIPMPGICRNFMQLFEKYAYNYSPRKGVCTILVGGERKPAMGFFSSGSACEKTPAKVDEPYSFSDGCKVSIDSPPENSFLELSELDFNKCHSACRLHPMCHFVVYRIADSTCLLYNDIKHINEIVTDESEYELVPKFCPSRCVKKEIQLPKGTAFLTFQKSSGMYPLCPEDTEEGRKGLIPSINPGPQNAIHWRDSVIFEFPDVSKFANPHAVKPAPSIKRHLLSLYKTVKPLLLPDNKVSDISIKSPDDNFYPSDCFRENTGVANPFLIMHSVMSTYECFTSCRLLPWCNGSQFVFATKSCVLSMDTSQVERSGAVYGAPNCKGIPNLTRHFLAVARTSTRCGQNGLRFKSNPNYIITSFKATSYEQCVAVCRALESCIFMELSYQLNCTLFTGMVAIGSSFVQVEFGIGQPFKEEIYNGVLRAIIPCTGPCTTTNWTQFTLCDPNMFRYREILNPAVEQDECRRVESSFCDPSDLARYKISPKEIAKGVLSTALLAAAGGLNLKNIPTSRKKNVPTNTFGAFRRGLKDRVPYDFGSLFGPDSNSDIESNTESDVRSDVESGVRPDAESAVKPDAELDVISHDSTYLSDESNEIQLRPAEKRTVTAGAGSNALIGVAVTVGIVALIVVVVGVWVVIRSKKATNKIPCQKRLIEAGDEASGVSNSFWNESKK